MYIYMYVSRCITIPRSPDLPALPSPRSPEEQRLERGLRGQAPVVPGALWQGRGDLEASTGDVASWGLQHGGGSVDDGVGKYGKVWVFHGIE